MEAIHRLIDGLEALARASKSQQKSIDLLGSVSQSQAKTIKALEDRVKALEDKCYGRDTLGDTSSNSGD